MKKRALILLCLNAPFCLYAMKDTAPNFETDDTYYSFNTVSPRDEASATLRDRKRIQKNKKFILYPTPEEQFTEPHCTVQRIIASPSKKCLVVLISKKIDLDDLWGKPESSRKKFPLILEPLKVKIFPLPLQDGVIGLLLALDDESPYQIHRNFPTPSQVIMLPTQDMPPAMIKTDYSPEEREKYRGYRLASSMAEYGCVFADDTYAEIAVSDDGKKVVLASYNQIMEFDTTAQPPLHKTVLKREEKKRKDDITFKKITLDEDNRLHVTYSDDSETTHDV